MVSGVTVIMPGSCANPVDSQGVGISSVTCTDSRSSPCLQGTTGHGEAGLSPHRAHSSVTVQ